LSAREPDAATRILNQSAKGCTSGQIDSSPANQESRLLHLQTGITLCRVLLISRRRYNGPEMQSQLSCGLVIAVAHREVVACGKARARDHAK